MYGVYPRIPANTPQNITGPIYRFAAYGRERRVVSVKKSSLGETIIYSYTYYMTRVVGFGNTLTRRHCAHGSNANGTVWIVFQKKNQTLDVPTRIRLICVPSWCLSMIPIYLHLRVCLLSLNSIFVDIELPVTANQNVNFQSKLWGGLNDIIENLKVASSTVKRSGNIIYSSARTQITIYGKVLLICRFLS